MEPRKADIQTGQCPTTQRWKVHVRTNGMNKGTCSLFLTCSTTEVENGQETVVG